MKRARYPDIPGTIAQNAKIGTTGDDIADDGITGRDT
jgi:hypothetical protein